MPRVLKRGLEDPHWPPKEEDPRDVVTFVVTSKPDSTGRQSYWIKWFDERWCTMPDKLDPRPNGWQRGWRAQHYFGELRRSRAYWQLTSFRIVVVERSEA